ncbi:TPR domain containing protein [Fusarium agapanthi]|uniref:TPR domain containing protein n=1 Tax=Fusarium agapanthi TaxID=1803897 RepID=A0A9P5BMC1_9HYPO|nr:TPR domain containing protein [Fusarium agapanthi]
MEEVQNEIKELQELIDKTAQESLFWAACMSTMSLLKHRLYRQTADPTVLDDCLSAGLEAVKATSRDDPQRGARLSDLASRLMDRYLITSVAADLEEAIRLTREAVKLIPLDHPGRAVALINHGAILSKRTSLVDLQEARLCSKEVIGMTDDDELRYQAMANIGAIDYATYGLSGDVSDLENSIRFDNLKINLLSETPQNQAIDLSNLAIRQRELYFRTGNSEALEEAVRIAREALHLVDESSKQYACTLTNFGTVLFNRYELSGAPVDLDDSIQSVKRVIALQPDGDPLRADNLRNLADRLGKRFSLKGVLEDIEEAVRADIEGLELTPTDHPKWVMYSSNVAVRLTTLYGETNESSDLEHAITSYTSTLQRTIETDPWWAPSAHNLGHLLGERHARTRSVSDLQNAIHLGKRSVARTTKDDPLRSKRLMKLASNLQRRYILFREASDVYEAVELGRDALAELPHSDTSYLRYQSQLGSWLGDKSMATGQISDLDEGVDLARLAYRKVPLGQGNFYFSVELSNLLALRSERNGDPASLNEAIDILKKSMSAMPENDQDREVQLTNLASYLGSRYWQLDDISDLDEAIDLASDALDMTQGSSDNYFENLNNLGYFLGLKYLKTGQHSYLLKAIQVISEGLEDIQEHHPMRPGLLNNLATEMKDQYLRTGDVTDLDKAIRLAEEASETDFKDHSIRALGTLGTLLGDRFAAKGNISDINRSIQVLQDVVAKRLVNHPDRPGLLSNLGIRFGERYTRTGSIEDLDESIRYTREAVSQTAQSHSEWTVRLGNLAARLSDRYTRIGRLSDIDDAIDIGRDLLNSDSVGPTQMNRSSILNNLGIHLSSRFERTGLLKDLDEAIGYGEESMNTLPYGHAEFPARLRNLGTRLNERYRKLGQNDQYFKSLEIGRKALQAAPPGHPLHSGCLTNMGSLLLIRYEKEEDVSVLEESILNLREALETVPKDHQDRADRLLGLGMVLAERCTRTKDLEGLDEAISYHRQAVGQANAVFIVRIRAARQLLRELAVASQCKEAFEAAEMALSMISQFVLRSLDNSDKQHLLGQVAGLACEAASMAIRGAQSPMTALRVLEQGRGIIAASIEDMRTDTMDLHSSHPELANKFLECKEVLNLASRRSKTVSDSTHVSQQYESERRFDDVVQEIRGKSGFEDFLLTPSASKMLACAQHGPIVVINISMFDSGALVMDDRGEWAVSLSKVKKEDVERRAESGDIDSLETLEWLWDVIANPVLEYLGLTHTPANGNWPHIWWIPTGALCKFPLHAAGYHLRGSGETVMDRAISSYSSSVRALILSHRQSSVPPTPAKALLVAIEETPGYDSLLYVRQEVEEIRAICNSMGMSVMEPKPRKVDIEPCLQECSIFHFAGHGQTDELDPSMSRLLLEEGQQNPLTVGELLEMNLRKASPFLAYLSACGTGRFKDEKFADESLHLIGACQVAGFRHVIGTLWKVQDDTCLEVARAIYQSLGDNGIMDTSVSRGLHNVVRRLRDHWLETRSAGSQKFEQVENPDDYTRDQKEDETGKKTKKRDVVIVGGLQESGLCWVPYVHFGV